MGGVVAELDEEGVLADVGGEALELEGLEAGPAEEVGVGGGELAEVLCEVFVGVADGGGGGLLDAGELACGVLADGLVGWPVCLLAV